MSGGCRYVLLPFTLIGSFISVFRRLGPFRADPDSPPPVRIRPRSIQRRQPLYRQHSIDGSSKAFQLAHLVRGIANNRLRTIHLEPNQVCV